MNKPYSPSQDILALINADIDHELDAEQRLQLDNILAADEGARQLHQQLSEVNQALNALPILDAPDSLAEMVLTRVEAQSRSKTASIAPRIAFADRLATVLGGYWRAGGVAIAVTGLLAIGLQQSLFRSNDLQHDQAMLGTVLPESKLSQTSEHRLLMHESSLAVNTEQVVGTLSLHKQGSELNLVLDIDRASVDDLTLRLVDSPYLIKELALGEVQIAQIIARNDSQHTFQLHSKNTQAASNSAATQAPNSASGALIKVEILSGKQLIYNNVFDVSKNN